MTGNWWSSPDSTHAYKLSIISIGITLAAALLGMIVFTTSGSSLMFVFGLENCVDFLSSVVVLWRFFCPGGISDEKEHHLIRREKRASIAISIILTFLGVFVFGVAIADFRRGEEDNDDLKTIVYSSFFSFITFGLLAIFKFHYSTLLQSASLQKDGICSLIGMALAGSLLMNSLLISEISSLWWLDPLVSTLAGLVSFIVGVQALYVAKFVQGLPITSVAWWAQSQGDGTDEISGRDLRPSDFGTSEQTPADQGEVEVV